MPPTTPWRRTAAATGLLVASLAAGCAGRSVPVEDQPLPPDEPRAAASAGSGTAAEEPDLDSAIEHVVTPGQTAWRIARAYGLTVEQLAAANGLDDPSRISVGQRLTIPGATTPLEVAVAPAIEGSWLWPISGGSVLSYFGAPRGKRLHQGLDIRGEPGQQIVAIGPGSVVYSGSEMRGYGRTVILDHGNGLQSLYAHNKALLVRVGDRVERGDTIARVGRSGNASTEHCHLELRLNERPIDPLAYLDRDRRGAHR